MKIETQDSADVYAFNSLLDPNTDSTDSLNDNDSQVIDSDSDTSESDVYNTEPPVNSDSNDGDTIMYKYLKSKGISDPSKIQFEDEDGNPYESDFNELTSEEQMNILNELNSSDFSDDEIETVNYLRQNNMSLKQVVDYFSNKAVQDYIATQQSEKTYSIDEYSDDELYVADLKAKYPEFSDEELLAKLDVAKNNTEMFEKEVSQLRSYYKSQEDAHLQQQAMRDEESQRMYINSLYDAVNNFNEIAIDYKDPKSDTIEIEKHDKERILSYLLDKDAQGKTQFVRDIENPDVLIELAYLRMCGAEMLSASTQYWKDQIKAAHRETTRYKNQPKDNVIITPDPKGRKADPSSPWDYTGLV